MKKWLKISFWALFAIAVITLLVLTQQESSKEEVNDALIEIEVKNHDPFLTKEEVKRILTNAHLIFEGQKIEELNIDAIEAKINDISQVAHAEVYQSVNDKWQIDITLRQAIARVFNRNQENYYIDTEGNPFATTNLHTSHCVVVTGEIEDGVQSENYQTIINNDSLISIRDLDDVYRISNYVCNDPLFHSLIGQIYLEKNGDFKLIPLVGDQVIEFGTATSENEVADKFQKLKIFYEEAISNEGWNKYSEISLKYEDQIVCKKREIY